MWIQMQLVGWIDIGKMKLSSNGSQVFSEIKSKAIFWDKGKGEAVGALPMSTRKSGTRNRGCMQGVMM